MAQAGGAGVGNGRVVVAVDTGRGVDRLAGQDRREDAALSVVDDTRLAAVRVGDSGLLTDGAVVDEDRLAEEGRERGAEEPVGVVLEAALGADRVAIGPDEPLGDVGLARAGDEDGGVAVGVGVRDVAKGGGVHPRVVGGERGFRQRELHLAGEQAAVDLAGGEAGEVGAVVEPARLGDDRPALVADDDPRQLVDQPVVRVGVDGVGGLGEPPALRLGGAGDGAVAAVGLADDVADGGVVVVGLLLAAHVVGPLAVLDAMDAGEDEDAPPAVGGLVEDIEVVLGGFDAVGAVRLGRAVVAEDLGAGEHPVQRGVRGAVAG